MPPLKGLQLYSRLSPMTYVMGYWYSAPPGLKAQSLRFVCV
jgi:hypothetical protein